MRETAPYKGYCKECDCEARYVGRGDKEAYLFRCDDCDRTDAFWVNKPTELGRQMGEQLARLTDRGEAVHGLPSERGRCSSCAFRKGTIPNGCEETVSDALDAVMTGRRFLCHMTKDEFGNPYEPCAGWEIASKALGALSLIG